MSETDACTNVTKIAEIILPSILDSVFDKSVSSWTKYHMKNMTSVFLHRAV